MAEMHFCEATSFSVKWKYGTFKVNRLKIDLHRKELNTQVA